MNLTQFENRISDVILERGYRYFMGGHVMEIHEERIGEFEVVVEGTTDYEVSVEVDTDGEILYSECTCPYDMGPVCKHEVAAYFKIREVFGASRWTDAVPEEELTKILENLSREELVSLLLEQAQKDHLLCQKLMLRGQPRNASSYIVEVERAIQRIGKNFSDRYGFIGYAEAMDYAYDMENQLEKASDVDDPLLKAEVAWRFLLAAVNALQKADDSSGGFSMLIDRAVETICEAAGEAVGSDPAASGQLLDRILLWSTDKVFDGWKYIRHHLLAAALELAGLPELRERLAERVIELIREADKYDRGNLLKLQMELIILGGDEEELNRFLDENIRYPDVREEAICRAAGEGEHERAIELARQGEEQDSESPGLVNKWRRMRVALYKKTGQNRPAEELAWELLVSGELDCYEELRELAEDSSQLYETAKLKLKQAETWRSEQVFLALIDRENDLPEMMARAWAEPSSITSYGERLAGGYPEEVADIYEAYIMETAGRSSNRGQYRELCKIIRSGLKTIGKERAASLIARIEDEYPRRSAMLDELGKLKREMPPK